MSPVSRKEPKAEEGGPYIAEIEIQRDISLSPYLPSALREIPEALKIPLSKRIQLVGRSSSPSSLSFFLLLRYVCLEAREAAVAQEAAGPWLIIVSLITS